jgi:hypothetical protein
LPIEKIAHFQIWNIIILLMMERSDALILGTLGIARPPRKQQGEAGGLVHFRHFFYE